MDNRFKHLGTSTKVSSLNDFETWSAVRSGAEYCTGTTLCLESPGSSSNYNSNLKGTKRKLGDIDGTEGLDHTSLILSLGRPPSSSDSSWRSFATVCTASSARETDEESSMDLDLSFQLHLGNESTPSPKNPVVATPKPLNNGPILDLQLSLSVGPSESVITSSTPVPAQHHNCCETSVMVVPDLTIDEESTSSRRKYGSLLPYTSEAASGYLPNQKVPPKADPVPNPDLTSTMIPMPKSPVACTSGVFQQQQQNTNAKKCQFQGCGKGARGASGLCIAHGGGRRCKKAGCQKGAEGRTIFCKAHGGGRRCEHLGCTKSAEGRSDHCIAHGGGRRCIHESCTRAARGKSGLCIRHGGGKRCKTENCTKSAEGYSGLCISHGGGRRCQHPECLKGAQGSTMFCKAHGGGRRCTFEGCSKGAEGSTPFCKGHGGGKRCSFQDGCSKSVHGGTLFCVAHGGGKRCAVPECTKSARGRTDFCVRHGGGKRCKSEGCGKSAQGSTDFCKAHGGGKRCSWGQPGSDLGAGGPSCDRFARGKIGLCAAHSALVQDERVHGGAMVGPITTRYPTPIKPGKMKEIAVEENMFSNQENRMHHMISLQSELISLPEGRVHGGNLMAMLASSAGLGRHPGSPVEGGGTSEQGLPNNLSRRWL